MRLPLLLTVMLVAAPAIAAPPIIGDWGRAGRPCVREAGVVRITALALGNDDVQCRFSRVRRAGETVIWQGECTYAYRRHLNETVTASLRGARLDLAFSGSGLRLENLRRCRRFAPDH